MVEWESFARTIWPKNAMADPVELRDSAAEILQAVVADMKEEQNSGQQAAKSMGRGGEGRESDRLDDASSVHAMARVESGLAICELVAEYRALRASVLRQWRASVPAAELLDLDDLTRFNEAVDQSLNKAVFSFTHRVEESRNMFLAILGHDMRNPLAAISLCATVAKAESASEDQSAMLSQIISSSEAISELLTDLIDFTRTRLGARLPLTPEETDLSKLCEEASNQLRAANPGRDIRCSATGDVVGRWDAHRLRQVLSNLLGNAVQHGSPSDPVTVRLDGSNAEAAILKVHNSGRPIPPQILPTIFDPLVRGRTIIPAQRRPGSIGLGLYIVKEVVTAHGGTVTMTSNAAEGTTATVRLPR